MGSSVGDRARRIYTRHANYIYPVPDAGAEKRFLLFNPGLHFWIALNATGAAIVNALAAESSLDQLAEDLHATHGVSGDIFADTVAPFVQRLIELKFYGFEPVDGSVSWVPENFTLETPEEYPFEDLIVSLGDRCNLTCGYCFNETERSARLAQGNAVCRISRIDIARTLREFRELGGEGVLFTGGEPTLNPEFLGICQDAKELGLRVQTITNGTRLSKLDAARLIEVVDSLAVSLDSLDDSINAKLWGTARYKVEKDILGPLGRIGRMRNSRGDQIRILIKPTVTRLNLPYFADLLVGAAERLAGCDVSIDISAYQKIGKDKTDLELSVTPEEFERELAAAATALMNRGFGAVPPANIAIAAESFALSCGGKLGDMDRPRILSCAPSFFVTNTGDVYPCQAFEVPEYRLGNVLENTSLRHMFDHGRFSELRRHMTRDDIEVCRDCEFRFVCTEHCHGCSFKSACKTNAFLGEDERACRSRTIKRLWLDTQNAREAAS